MLVAGVVGLAQHPQRADTRRGRRQRRDDVHVGQGGDQHVRAPASQVADEGRQGPADAADAEVGAAEARRDLALEGGGTGQREHLDDVALARGTRPPSEEHHPLGAASPEVVEHERDGGAHGRRSYRTLRTAPDARQAVGWVPCRTATPGVRGVDAGGPTSGAASRRGPGEAGSRGRWVATRATPGRDARRAADVDPMLETYRSTRPRQPLPQRLGVTVAPDHPDAVSLRAAASELGGDVVFFDPDDPDWPRLARAAGRDGHLVHLRHGTQVDAGPGRRPAGPAPPARRAPPWPTPREAYLYEDKARAAWLFAALDVPHVPTRTFARLADAGAWLGAATYPLSGEDTERGRAGAGSSR